MNYSRIIGYGLLALLISGGGQSYGSSDTPDSPVSPAPCSEPLTWWIGDVDPRFNLDESALKEIMHQVEELWSDAAGRKVLAYSDSGKVALSFIYGKAQKVTDTERELSERIDQVKLQHDALEEEYESLYYRHEKMSEEYLGRRDEYIETVDEYNWTVRRAGKEGVVQELDKTRLGELKQEIETQEKTLRGMEQSMNEQVQELVALSSRMESAADRVNKLIYSYNERFVSARTFYQGVYIDDLNHKKINIYEFGNIGRLKLVLAHEAGHALGLGHLATPTSVMHFKMEYQNMQKLQLSDEDRQAIRAKCEG